MKITITSVGDNEIEARFDRAPLGYIEVVANQMRSVVDLLYSKVTEKVSGGVIRVGSGRLAASIQKRIEIGESTVIGTIFSDGSVPYFGIQERGGQTRPHDIVVRNARALRFLIGNGGQEVAFAVRVKHPGSKIPPHWFMRDSLRESVDVIRSLFQIDESKL